MLKTGKLYQGYVIKNNGERIDGYIEAQRRGSIDSYLRSNQTCVIFYSDPDNKRMSVVYTPDSIKEYMIADKYYISMH